MMKTVTNIVNTRQGYVTKYLIPDKKSVILIFKTKNSKIWQYHIIT